MRHLGPKAPVGVSGRPPRGLTLIETLLSVTLFFVMLGAVVVCERTMRSAAPRTASRSEVDRLALVAFEKVRSELKGAMVQPSDNLLELTFFPPLRDPDGQVRVGPTGEALFADEPQTLTGGDGELRRGSQLLARLGEKGWVTFELEEDSPDLLVTVHAETEFVRELRGRIPLPNQN